MKFKNKTLNKIKLELFYIRRLLQEGYGPRYWWPYFKNRFFQRYLTKNLSHYEYEADPDLELHTICHKDGIYMLFWMLRSFLKLSKLRPTIIVNDDGTLDKEAEEFLKSKFSNIKILFREETAKLAAEIPGIPEIVRQVTAKGHFFMHRLISVLALSKAKKVIVMDIDILFYKPPTELVDFVFGRLDCDALVHRQPNEVNFDMMVDETYDKKYKLTEKQIALMNGGFLILDRDKINFDQLAEYLAHAKRPITDYFIEMVAWACLLAQMNFKFLSPERYAIKGFLNDQMVFKHYSGPRRYEMFAYGLDAMRKVINE